MCSTKNLHQKIEAFHRATKINPHHRYRSWEHCYQFFHTRTPRQIVSQREIAALNLSFYLASWGMYRGSSFLLRHSYTVHLDLVERLTSGEFRHLWNTDIGSQPPNPALVESIRSLVEAVKKAYAPFGRATDTLATKVILGTVGCLPAVDRFFVDGFKASGHHYWKVNPQFIERMIRFCNECLGKLRAEQRRIERKDRVHYPLMKLADMYFWQIGSELGRSADPIGE